MNPRVLFVGNSHMGCVKLAIGAVPELTARYRIDFMAVTNDWVSDLSITDGKLHLTADRAREIASRASLAFGAASEATISDYSAIVMIGLGATMIGIGRLYLSHRLFMHRCPERKLLSRPAFDAMVEDYFFQSGARLLTDKLRSVTRVPLLLVPEPPLNESVQDAPEWNDVWTGGHASFLAETYQRWLSLVFSRKGVDILSPPPRTLVPPCFTKTEYGRGALNLFKPREVSGLATHQEFRNDYRHMNKAYGGLLCQDIARWLALTLEANPRGYGLYSLSPTPGGAMI